MNQQLPRRSVLQQVLSILTPKASKQVKQQMQTLQRPAPDDRDAWHAYWQAHQQPWRCEPEIDAERQRYLAEHRRITPNIEQGVFPFKDIKLSRADVEWLLVTHEGGKGPIDWNDEKQRTRKGLDLRGADLCTTDLQGLPLTRLQGGLNHDVLWVTEEQCAAAAILMEKANLSGTHLEGADLKGAYLEKADLCGAHLEGADLDKAHLEKAHFDNAHLEGAYLNFAHLEGAFSYQAHLELTRLWGTHLEGAFLWQAHLEGADLKGVHLEQANLSGVHLEGATLYNVHLERADLSRANLEGADLSRANLEGANLEEAVLGDEVHIGPQVADVQWSSTNLAVVDWSQVHILGDEYEARQKTAPDGKIKESETRLREYQTAVRANRQLAVALQAQGLNEEAARFAYRAQTLQKNVFRLQLLQPKVKLKQRVQALGAWLFSWFLFLLAGYGYRVWRSFAAYILVIGGFATAYYLLGLHDVVGPHHVFGPYHLTWNEAIVVSMTAFHGRGFFANQFQPADPQAFVAAFEAFVGLLIEITFIATLTRRLFGQ